MRPSFDFALIRVLLLALLALLAAQAPPASAQQAVIGYTKRVFTDPAVTERHETNTRIVTQHWDSAGNLLATNVCSAPAICNPAIPRGSARYAMVLEYDGAREELVASSCNNVPDTVPQGQCINTPLRVTMRVRFGEVRWRFVADPRPDRPYAAPFGGQFGPTPRMEFPSTGAVDPVKWWVPNKYVNRGGSLGGILTAAGTYELKLDPMSGHCKPVHTNPNDRLTVNEGQLVEFTVRYTGTVCTMSIQSYGTSADRVPDSAGTFTSDPAGLSCNANPSARTCKAEFRFDSTVRLIGNPNPGYTSSFGRNFTGCSRDEPDPRICQILVDGDRELSSTMYATTAPPPPPPPVTLTVAAGPAAPVDGAVAKGSTDVPMLQLLLTPANGAVRLQSLTLQASGSGRDDLDLREVRVYADRNNDGNVDAGEPLLARGSLSADNGSLRLVLATPLELSEATTLVVVADIASTVHSAAAAIGGLTLALGAVGWVRSRRARSRFAAPAVLALALLLAACGGDGSDPAPADPPSPAPVPSPPPPAPPAPPPPAPTPPPPVLLTYRLQLTAVQAIDTAATPANLTVSALPLSGAQITVER